VSTDAPRTDPRQSLGDRGETIAARHLEEAGWRIVARNWRPAGVGLRGEIDLVAARPGVLAFVEVKSRRGDAFGGPLAAVTPSKQRRIRRLATAFLREHQLRAERIRFDVVAVRFDGSSPAVEHLEAAF
jgi:putative endonuclease